MKKKNDFKFKVISGPDENEIFSTQDGPASGGDDCPICQAMKAAKEGGKELTEKELKETFKKAKEGGAIVGGEWFG